MYITAAPVGAIPKYLNPNEPKFISLNFINNEPRGSGIKTISSLLSDGWKECKSGGLSFKPSDSSIIETKNFKPKSLVIDRDLVESLKNVHLIRDVYIVLTTQGWQVDRVGNLTLPHKQTVSYIHPGLVDRLRAENGDVVEALMGLGWEVSSEGYWQPGNISSPYLPITVEDILEECKKCYTEGASIIHLHTRDTNEQLNVEIAGIDTKIKVSKQSNKIDTSQYEALTPLLHRFAPDGILNFSTSTRGGGGEDALRRSHLKEYGDGGVIPAVASLSPGEVVFTSGGGYKNEDAFVEDQIAHFKALSIRPEIEVFNRTILQNCVGKDKDKLETAGNPVLFMLVAGVSQCKCTEVNGALVDDSLIPNDAVAEILSLLKNESTIHLSVDIIVRHLVPVVTKIRQAFRKTAISILLPGKMQQVIVDVAIALSLDGVRVGLEDSLNVRDEGVPGFYRRAKGSFEQVGRVREELERKGVKVLSPDETRVLLNIKNDDCRDFEEAMAFVKNDLMQLKGATNFDDVIARLCTKSDSYDKREELFVKKIVERIGENSTPEIASAIIRDLAFDLGIYIRYFVEENDRYDVKLDNSVLHISQDLNHARELLFEYNCTTKIIDEYLLEISRRVKVSEENSNLIIPIGQFKGRYLRYLEYLTTIPSKYNYERSRVYNMHLRSGGSYSIFLSRIYQFINHLVRTMRTVSKADLKVHSPIWYRNILEHRNNKVSVIERNENISEQNLEGYIDSSDWIVLPSTPTTNYPLGIELSQKLTMTFSKFIAKTMKNGEGSLGLEKDAKKIEIIGIVHSGRDLGGGEIIESNMLFSRFSTNHDSLNKYFTSNSEVLYESLLLPRVINNPGELLYDDNHRVIRDYEGVPLYNTGERVRKICQEDIESLNIIKFIAHSSGITTAQQMDNILKKDLDILGFDDKSKSRIFDKSIVVSFSSASDISMNNFGSSVIDITACNDIRSMSGTTTSDYIPSSAVRNREYISNLYDYRCNGFTEKTKEYSDSTIFKINAKNKKLLRFTNVFLMEDPNRFHDGHSIVRYLGMSPGKVKNMISLMTSCESTITATEIFEISKKF